MPEPTIRVVIVDDYEMVRRGLVSFLNSFDDIELVGEARNGTDAIELCRQTNPDVVLMDLMMTGMDGITAIGKIHQAQPKIQIIALTSSTDTESVTATLEAGALSYLQKYINNEQLVVAIRAAHRGERTLSPEATHALIKAATRPPTTSYQLSERELEVLHYIVGGLTNAEIADKMFISRSTVKFHVSSILSKLNVSGRAEAITIAIKSGLVS